VAALLGLLKVADHTQRNKLNIFTYVAAKSYPRILRKFQHDFESKPFIDAILDIPPAQAINSGRLFLKQRSTDSTWSERDTTFVEVLSRPVSERFLGLSQIGIPNIIRLVKSYQKSSARDRSAFYNPETCEDFHRLLCHLLRRYEAALTTLLELENNSSEDTEEAVFSLTVCGLTLHALVYSSFLEDHLCCIRAPSLHPFRRSESSHMDIKSDAGEPLACESIESKSQMDSSLQSVRNTYVNCLKSQVAHFEAARQFVASGSRFRDTPVAIQIISPPSLSTEMLPWRRVLKDIMSLNPGNPYSYSDDEAIEAIAAIERAVSAHAVLEKRLKDKNEWIFGGTLHCAAHLACIINSSDPFETDLSDVSDFDFYFHPSLILDPRMWTRRWPFPTNAAQFVLGCCPFRR